MARTTTRTVTRTFNRTDFVAFQINFIVKETTGSDSFKRLAEVGIAKNQWIEVVNVYGIKRDNRVYAHIVMRIDWDRHRMHIAAGRGVVAVGPSGSETDLADNGVRNIVEFFKKVVVQQNLKSQWTVAYAPDVDERHADDTLGLIDATGLERASGQWEPVGKLLDKADEVSVDLLVRLPEEEGEVRDRSRGRLKRFVESKGYGFIVRDGDRADVFVHISQIPYGDHGRLTPGRILEFDVEEHYKGLRAVNVKVID